MKFEIDENYADVRLDKFLRKKYKDLPLSHIYNMIRKGKAKINGKKSKENYRLQKGDILEVKNNEVNKENFMKVSEKDIEFLKEVIIYDKDDIVVVNKPSGIVVHKGSNHEYGILEMLKAYYKSTDLAFVNRIDKSTSGLVLAGKNNKTVRDLSQIMRLGNIRKYYYAKVKGVPQNRYFQIKSKLAKKETKVEKNSIGKESITNFTLLKTDGKYSILEAELLTGRTHQIRVQLADENLPILGDGKYGIKSKAGMCLFSHRIIIEDKSIDINLDIPSEKNWEIQEN